MARLFRGRLASERLALTTVREDGHTRPLSHNRALGQRQCALAHNRTAHAAADLRGVHLQLGERAAKCVAVHAKLRGRLALIALVVGQHLKNVALLKLLDCVGISNAGSVHLRYQGVQLALQRATSLIDASILYLPFACARGALVPALLARLRFHADEY